jgi:rhodanese-related sulfurtransferase
VVVLLVVLMALFMFWGSEKLEAKFGRKDLAREPKLRYYGAASLVLVALVILAMGQPTLTQKWEAVAAQKVPLLEQRAVQIHPGELLASLGNDKLNVIMFDVRSEADYNLFHIHGAANIPIQNILSMVPDLLTQSQASTSTVVVLMSNDERAATQAWQVLVAEAIPNVYILEGGLNNWISVFGKDDPTIHLIPSATSNDQLRYSFEAALGDRYPAADPLPYEWSLEYTPKIQLLNRRGISGGGCG